MNDKQRAACSLPKSCPLKGEPGVIDDLQVLNIHLELMQDASRGNLGTVMYWLGVGDYSFDILVDRNGRVTAVLK